MGNLPPDLVNVQPVIKAVYQHQGVYLGLVLVVGIKRIEITRKKAANPVVSLSGRVVNCVPANRDFFAPGYHLLKMACNESKLLACFAEIAPRICNGKTARMA
jgi:hypothetical protein